MIKLKTLVSELLTEEIIRLFPEWNGLQVAVFKEILSLNLFSREDLINNMGNIGKITRKYMDDNFPMRDYPTEEGDSSISGWDTGNINFNQIKNDLINVVKDNYELSVPEKVG